jgi:hypothetical protein
LRAHHRSPPQNRVSLPFRMREKNITARLVAHRRA